MAPSHLPTTLHLVDRNPRLIRYWEQVFAPFDTVEVIHGDFFSQPADAMVSPANSFGIMDGGLDKAIRDTLGGVAIQHRVHDAILSRHHGEIPVGTAEIITTSHPTWPHLIIAPTMRIPESVAQTLNPYLAFRAILLTAMRFNATHPKIPITSVLIPGLGTGVGGMDERKYAAQMRIAYNHVSRPAHIPSFDTIHKTHLKLRSP